MNLVGAVNSMTGKRYYNNGLTVGTKGASFQQSLTAARATAEGAWQRATIILPGVPVLQDYRKHYVKGSAPLPAELSKEQLQSLAEKYDLQTITNKSLDSFLGDLVDTGLFTKDELDSAIYGEDRQVGVLPEGRFLPYQTPGMSPIGADYEMQEWANANDYLLGSSDASIDGTPIFSVKRASTLMKLMPILERMEQLRR